MKPATRYAAVVAAPAVMLGTAEVGVSHLTSSGATGLPVIGQVISAAQRPRGPRRLRHHCGRPAPGHSEPPITSYPIPPMILLQLRPQPAGYNLSTLGH